MNAISMLKEDHAKVKKIFEQFEKSKDKKVRRGLMDKAISELKTHATVEEEIFYPAVRKAMGQADLLDEADEEHHVAKLLIAELDQTKSVESHRDAKFIVLAENVRHHIKEEEKEMFPKVRKTKLDLEAIGELMAIRKQDIEQHGLPRTAEEKMVDAVQGKGDSPAATADRRREAKSVFFLTL